ncbi:hypothetical protein CAPTEDRAFT_202413 [Capitella teleta]|uniref:G-protein coupled receptors family 3 profile domain-containing protein n=1 Tax=Capitella teleta TaxID=283909 RepID=R7TZ56_CAPTE|nr:hypothetical protein CAPTEDRAFT_202413 [Capitella teleta]|eukprot:ELT99213.1 hypothetical protein CAPTEDRAFT_202413 [Capitella teleta]
MCDGTERQTKQNGYVPEAQLQFVSDAVMAFGVALRNMHFDFCGGESNPGLCPEMDPYDGQLLRDYLLKVNFTGLSGEPFHFLPNGDGPPRYRILNFRQVSPGEYKWITIEDDLLQFTANETTHPSSFCSPPCAEDEAQIFVEGDHCCWTCTACTGYQFLNTPHECAMCPEGTKPSPDRKACLSIPEQYLHYDSGIAIAAMSVAGLGILVTLWIITVFVRFRETPVVKASGRELSFVLLSGILICYALTFVIISRPNNIVCGAQKFGIGFCFSLCYAALLTKTNRIARIFRAGKRTVKRPKFISPQSQLVICFGLVSVQMVIGVLWLMLSPPEAGHYYPSREEKQFVCMSAVGASYIVGLAYPILLIIVCTVYAVLTRKIPEGFNESKYIGFTMYTTCIIWLAFVPIYFSTANRIEIRLAVLSFSISLSATVALVCLFAPKLTIILLHPERNEQKRSFSISIEFHTKETKVYRNV